MFWASCEQCDKDSELTMGADLKYYCNQCWEFEELKHTRCFSFSVIYNENGEKISCGSSHIGIGCAERVAMWKLDDLKLSEPKILIVARIRRNRNNKKLSFGKSKPCKECITAMHFYNIKRIGYSNGKNLNGQEIFEWVNLNNLHNTYSSCSKVIVKM